MSINNRLGRGLGSLFDFDDEEEDDDFDNEVEIEICGIATEIGIICLALTLRSLCPYAPITIHDNCCAGITEETHTSALKIMSLCGINVVNS